MRVGIRAGIHDGPGPLDSASGSPARLRLGHARRRLAGRRGRLDSRSPGKFPRGDAGDEGARRQHPRRGVEGAALVEPAGRGPGIPDRARASGVAAEESGRLVPRDHLVGRALPLSGARKRPGGRRGVRPQGPRRVGLRRLEDRRPAPERRAARASRQRTDTRRRRRRRRASPRFSAPSGRRRSRRGPMRSSRSARAARRTRSSRSRTST